MKVEIDFENLALKKQFPFSKLQIKKILSKTISRSGLKNKNLKVTKNQLAVSIFIGTDPFIRNLNKQYRDLDRSTDVLSFSTLETQLNAVEIKEVGLGDIVLSLAAVRRGAKRAKRTLKEECLEVIIHGILHLLGYDHVRGPLLSQKEAKLMKALQRKLYLELKKDISLR